jgi:hypothetical protein
MNTIVLHAETLAVTEYTPAFTGLSPNFAVLGGKLCSVGGTADDAAVIAPVAEFGFVMNSGWGLQRPRFMYALGDGGTALSAYVKLLDGTRYDYTTPQLTRRSTRFTLGGGLRDNYLQFGITGDASVTLEQVAFETAGSQQRRI